MNATHASHPVRAPLAVSLVLSVLVHVGAVGSVAAVFSIRQFLAQFAPLLGDHDAAEAAAAKDTAPDPALAHPPPEVDPVTWVQPGIDDGAADSETWIGYKTASEHAAFQSAVNQSAMTPDMPGMRGAADTITPSTETGEPQPLGPAPAPAITKADPAPVIPAPEAPAPQPPTKPAETAQPAPPESPIAPAEAPEPKPAPNEEITRETDPVEHPAEENKDSPREEAPPPAPPSPAPDKQAPPEPKPGTPPQTSPTPSDPAPHPQETPGTTKPGSDPKPVPAGDPGAQADKEADATSIKNAVNYHNGRVQAGEGIDIKTVRPEFTNLTLLTAMPRTPIVEITFTPKGKVKNVRMLQSSGYKDVDEPIISAVWAWTAKGKKLDALVKLKPNAVLKLSVKMLL